jgi:HTH-type transcriptional regulator / antitoxin HigA
MKLKILKNESDYYEAVKELESLDNNPDFENNPELIEKSELLEKLVEDYDKEHYPIEKGHPIEIIKLKMDYMGLKRKDLIPAIGTKGSVSDILNKKRKLSKKMIRELSKLLEISQEILNTEYELSLSNCNEQNKNKLISNKDVFFNLSGGLLSNVENYANKVFQRGSIMNFMSIN